jgi:hypothetical protein
VEAKQENDKKFVDEHIRIALSSCFFGEIRIKFEHGKVVQLKKEQCFKPKN